jgi:hypothetical protein
MRNATLIILRCPGRTGRACELQRASATLGRSAKPRWRSLGLTAPKAPDSITSFKRYERATESAAFRLHAATAATTSVYAAAASSGTDSAAAVRGSAAAADLYPKRSAPGQEELDPLDYRRLWMPGALVPHRGRDRVQCLPRQQESH